MNIALVCGFIFVTIIVILMLKKQNAEHSFIVTIGAVSIIVLYVISKVMPTFDFIRSVFERSGLKSDYLGIMLKCVGICYLTEFSCECCKDASQSALAGSVLIAGRVSVLLAALPLYTEFLEFVVKLAGGTA